MRLSLSARAVMAIIVIATLAQIASANAQIMLIDEDDIVLEPHDFWTLDVNLIPKDICTSKNGTVFIVAVNRLWSLEPHGSFPRTLFMAWKNNGELLWSKSDSNWDLALLGVTTDDSFVYVTGCKCGTPFVGKYDFSGKSIWNWTRNTEEHLWGIRISVTDDGYVVMRASSSPIERMNFDNYLFVLNSLGELQWQKPLAYCSFVAIDSNFMYVKRNNTLEALYHNGTMAWQAWSSKFQNKTQILAHDGVLYSINDPSLYNGTYFRIERLDPFYGEVKWTVNVRMADRGYIMHGWTYVWPCTPRNGSLILLLNLFPSLNEPQLGRWNIVAISQEGLVTQQYAILDSSWQNAVSETDCFGRLFVAGLSSETNLTIAIYGTKEAGLEQTSNTTSDSSMGEILKQIDMLLISICLVSVITLDAYFIRILKRKYPR